MASGRAVPSDAELRWEDAFVAKLEGGDPVGAVDLLLARVPEKREGAVYNDQLIRAARLIDRVRPSPLVRLDWGARLLVQPRETHRRLGGLTLGPIWRVYPREVERAIVVLAEDERWGVRETAADLIGAILDEHFVVSYPLAMTWAARGSSRLRRAAVVGAMRAARAEMPDRAPILLDLVEPALADPDGYVRTNLGAFVLGDHLLRAYPEPTLTRLEGWGSSEDANVRWNVAMAFSSAESAKHVARALAILGPLAADERRLVWRAAASALRNLARRRPAEVRATLFAWREDPARRRAAETAIALAPSVRV